jgi:hypothetical protein
MKKAALPKLVTATTSYVDRMHTLSSSLYLAEISMLPSRASPLCRLSSAHAMQWTWARCRLWLSTTAPACPRLDLQVHFSSDRCG